MKNYLLIFILVFSLELNAQGDQTSTTPPAESGDSLSCFGICDEFTKWARQYIDKLTAGAQKKIDNYVSMADFDMGSAKFGIKGNADLGQLKLPSYNCAKGDGGKLGTGDFGLKPSYKIHGLIFGQSVDIVDVRLSGKQEGYTTTAQNKDDKGIKLQVKIVGIDVLNKKNKGPTGQLEKKAPTTATTTPTTPAPKKDSDFLPPKPDKKGTGGKFLDIARKITDNGPMPRVDIIPPVLYVGIDAGFHLSAQLMFTYGVTSPFYSYRSTTVFNKLPLSSLEGFCESPPGPTDTCTPKSVTTSSRSSIYDDIKNSVGVIKDNVNSTVSSFENLQNKAKDVKVKKAFKDAKAAYEHSQEEENAGDFCSNLSSVLRPVQELGDQVQGSIEAAKETQANVNQLVNSVGALYKQSEQAANLIGAVVDGKFENIPELTADVAVRLNGRASAWVQALLILDAVVAQAYGGLEGRVVLVDASMGIGAQLSTKSKYLDFTSEFTLLRLKANLDAVYGIKSSLFNIPEGRKPLLQFPGYITHKESVFARLDFRPNPGQNPFVWCGGMFGSPDDPARCNDTPDGFSEVALGLALHDRVTKEYLGEPSLDLDAGCLISDLSGNIIATGNGRGNCESNFLSLGSEFVKTKLAEVYRTQPALFLSYARDSGNRFKFGLNGVGRNNTTTRQDPYTSQPVPPVTFNEENKTVVVSDFYPNDPYSENPNDWIYSITNMGISFINKTTGDVEEADRTKDEFQIFVSKEGDQLDTSTEGDYKLFVGDIIGLPNKQIVDLAKNYRLGACVLETDNNDEDRLKKILVRNVGYPKLNSDVLDAIADDQTRKLAIAGDLNTILELDGAGCNEVQGNLEAYAACQLRKAFAEERCFPKDKVIELIFMANLTNEEAWGLFKNKEISGVIRENFENYSENIFRTNTRMESIRYLGDNTSRIGFEEICPTDYFSEGACSTNSGVMPTNTYAPSSKNPTCKVEPDFRGYMPSGSVRQQGGLNGTSGFSSRQGTYVPSNGREHFLETCISYERGDGARYVAKQSLVLPSFSEILSITPSRSTNDLVHFPYTLIGNTSQDYADANGAPRYAGYSEEAKLEAKNSIIVLGKKVKDCVIGSESESCSIILGSSLSMASSSQSESSSYCKVKVGDNFLENIPNIKGNSFEGCLVEGGMTDLSLFCNKHRSEIFGSTNSTSLSEDIKLVFYDRSHLVAAINKKSSDSGNEFSSSIQTMGTCRRDSTQVGATIVGIKNDSQRTEIVTTIATPTSSYGGTLPPPVMSLSENPPYNALIDDPLAETNCALLIGTSSQKKNFSQTFAKVEKEVCSLGSSVSDMNRYSACLTRNNQKVTEFINTCIGEGAEDINQFCNTLPSAFITSLGLNLNVNNQLQLQVVPTKDETSTGNLNFESAASAVSGTTNSSSSSSPWIKTCTLSPQKIAAVAGSNCGIRLTQGLDVNIKVSLPLVPLDPPLSGLHSCGGSIERNLLTSNFNNANSVWSLNLAPDVRQNRWVTSLCEGVNRIPQAILLSSERNFTVSYEGVPDSILFNCNRPTLDQTLANQNSDCKLLSWLTFNDSNNGQHQEFLAISSTDTNNNCRDEFINAMSSPLKSVICETNKKTYSNTLGHVERVVADRNRFPLNAYSSNPASFGTNIAFNYNGGAADDVENPASGIYECAFLLIPTRPDDYSVWKKGGSIPSWGSAAHPVRMVTTDEFRSFDNDFGSTGFEDKDSMACVKQSHSVGPSNSVGVTPLASRIDGVDNIDDGRNCMQLIPNQKILFAGPGVTAIHRLPLNSNITSQWCSTILSQTDTVQGKVINRTEADLQGKVKVWIRTTDASSNIIGGVPVVRDEPSFECSVPSCNVRVGTIDNYLAPEMALLSTKPTNLESCRGLIRTYTSTSCSVPLATDQPCPSDKIVPSMLCSKIAQDPSLPSGNVSVVLKFGETLESGAMATCTVPAKSCQMALVNDFIPGRPLRVTPTNLQTVPNATSIGNCDTLIRNIESSRNDDQPEPSLCSSELAATATVDRTRPYSLIASYGGTMREIRKCPLAPKISETPFVENGVLKLKHTVTVGDTQFEGMLAFVYLERSTLPASDCTSPSLSYVPVYSSNLDDRTEGGFIVPTTNQIGTATTLPGKTYCLRAWSGRAEDDIKSNVPRNEYFKSPVVTTRMVVPARCEIEADIGQSLARILVGTGGITAQGVFKGNFASVAGADNYYKSMSSCLERLTKLTTDPDEEAGANTICTILIEQSGELPTNRSSLLTRVKFGGELVNLPAGIEQLCVRNAAAAIPNWGASTLNRCGLTKTTDNDEVEYKLNPSKLATADIWPVQRMRSVVSYSRSASGTVTPLYFGTTQIMPLIDTYSECQKQTLKFKGRSCQLDYTNWTSDSGSDSTVGVFIDERWPVDPSCQYPSIFPLKENNISGLVSWIDTSFQQNIFKDQSCKLNAVSQDNVLCLKDRLTNELFKVLLGQTRFPKYGRLTDDNVRPERHHLLVDSKTGNGLSGRMSAKVVGSIFVVYRNSPAPLFSTPFTTAAFPMAGDNGTGRPNGAHGLLHGDNQHSPAPVLRSNFRDNGFDFAQKWVFPKPSNYRIYNFNLSEPIRVGEVDYFLGSDRGSLSRLINGGVAEVLMYANPLGRAQIEQIEGYLACKWGLQNDLYPGHPYRLSVCDPLIDSSGPIKTDEVISENTLSAKDPVSPTIVVEKGKEFCGSVVDTTKLVFKTFTLGFCKEDKCTASDVAFKKSYTINSGEKFNWVTKEFVEEFGQDLIDGALARKQDFIPAVIYLDEKPIATSLYFNSSDAQVSEECGYGN